MHTNFTDHLLQAISWTFIHSLWQGLILSIVAGMIVLMTKKASASLRYALLTGSFFLFLGVVLTSFIIEWNTSAAIETDSITVAGTADTAITVYQVLIHKMVSGISAFLTANAYWIVLIWMVVILFKTIKILFDLMYVSRLRSQQIYSPGEAWNIRIQELAGEIGIRKTVRFVESALVKVPLVIGHLKPVILMPAGIVNSLSAGEVEAVLLHELAHIRRHDYLVNFMQRISETILFFNPALLWVSSLMRIERENCCDDIAIAKTDNRLQFAEALISFKEFSMDSQRYAMGLFGRKSVLLQRMTRIVYKKNKTLSVFESVFLSLNLLFFSLLVMGTGKKQDTEKKELPAQTTKLSYTMPEQPVVAIAKKEMVYDDQKQDIKRLYARKQTVHRTSISPESEVDHRPVEPSREEIEAHEIRENIIQAESRQLNDLQQYEIRRLQAERDRQQAEIHRQQAEQDRKQAEEHRKLAEIARAEAQKHREEAEIHRKQADKNREEAEKNRQIAEEHRKQFDEDRKHIDRTAHDL